MTDLNAILAPGMFVRHPDFPEWGTGQVQSSTRTGANAKITVNFPETGKIVIDATRIALVPVFDP